MTWALELGSASQDLSHIAQHALEIALHHMWRSRPCICQRGTLFLVALMNAASWEAAVNGKFAALLQPHGNVKIILDLQPLVSTEKERGLYYFYEYGMFLSLPA